MTSSGTNKRLESSIYSTLVVQTIDLTREREREPLIECHSNRQEILMCASWKYSVFGSSWNKKQAFKIWTWSVLDLPGWNNWLMNEAATTFEKLDYWSSFIHATLGIPRLFFTVWTDKSIEAKLRNGTIDVFLMHDLRVMYRKAVTVLHLSS